MCSQIASKQVRFFHICGLYDTFHFQIICCTSVTSRDLILSPRLT